MNDMLVAGVQTITLGLDPSVRRAKETRNDPMSATTHNQSEECPNPEIVSTRIFDAPREAVFRAFTDPDILARWWGPRGFTNTFDEFNPQPGGAWRFVMRGPDGTEYTMVKEFVEVVPLERIVLQHIDPVHRFRMEMTFVDEARGTRLTWRMRFEDTAEAERVRGLVLEANEQNFDRLKTQLDTRVSRVPPNA